MSLQDIYHNLDLETEYEDEVVKTNNRLYTMAGDLDDKLLQKSAQDVQKRTYELMGRLQSRGIQSSIQSSSNSEDILSENLYVFSHALQAHSEHRWPSRSSGYVVSSDNRPDYFLKDKLSEILNDLPLLDIGYRFNDGEIIKTGAQELDEALIIENLHWLQDYPNARNAFSQALKHYLAGDYEDAITNSYSSLESLVKTILNTKKRLDTDEVRTNLLQKLNLDSYWSPMLHNFSSIAHEYSSRHGSQDGDQNNMGEELVEFYIYITGTFIRLISQVVSDEQND